MVGWWGGGVCVCACVGRGCICGGGGVVVVVGWWWWWWLYMSTSGRNNNYEFSIYSLDSACFIVYSLIRRCKVV